MPLPDNQYYESPEEQDKVRRRIEIKNRLKKESVNLKYNPFRMMQKQLYQDPAVDRYLDMRKNGLTPSGAINRRLYFTYMGVFFGTIYVTTRLIAWERATNEQKFATGKIPYQDRWCKPLV